MVEAMTVPFVETTLAYIDPAYGPTVLYEYKREQTTHHYDPRRVPVHDARAARNLSLDRNGFTLIQHRSAVADFRDADQIKRVYYPEIERLVMSLTGAEKVLVFGDVLRSDDPHKKPLVPPPAASAHATTMSSPIRRKAKARCPRCKSTRRPITRISTSTKRRCAGWRRACWAPRPTNTPPSAWR